MSAPPKKDVPVITPAELADADCVFFGFPTRFSMMAAQFKAFMDATGGLWRTQQLPGKPAGIFYSMGSQDGGGEVEERRGEATRWRRGERDVSRWRSLSHLPEGTHK